MAFFRWFGGSVGTVLVTAVAANAGAVAPTDLPSVNDRVAVIRAKAAELSAAYVQDAFDGPPQIVAWNDWKNG